LNIYKKKQTKDRNIITAIINTSALLGEEGTRTIEDLKRKMVLMEGENRNAIK
jgi:hypothetical protein